MGDAKEDDKKLAQTVNKLRYSKESLKVDILSQNKLEGELLV